MILRIFSDDGTDYKLIETEELKTLKNTDSTETIRKNNIYITIVPVITRMKIKDIINNEIIIETENEYIAASTRTDMNRYIIKNKTETMHTMNIPELINKVRNMHILDIIDQDKPRRLRITNIKQKTYYTEIETETTNIKSITPNLRIDNYAIEYIAFIKDKATKTTSKFIVANNKNKPEQIILNESNSIATTSLHKIIIKATKQKPIPPKIKKLTRKIAQQLINEHNKINTPW